MYFKADRVPGTYCSTGNAICNDLDPDKRCNCRECEIWKEYNIGEGFPELNFVRPVKKSNFQLNCTFFKYISAFCTTEMRSTGCFRSCMLVFHFKYRS